ncbi:hypothetical protein HB667_26685 [Bacillus cereus]|uniref:hypothetical protein n=1 Tax=Bacillus cereus group TaxID=86661 RepID=UPI0014441792|nr:hypothetical protein [Bacillus cereus]NKW77401.1 hypothetical protein [Bacillus cereus]NKX14818.1 hypothetical protein [Bacillus cereus]HDR8003453.1 hypothetical protein [Bacillus cereus]HDR8015000.1 hypothetical protein [Bacillus cereus]
MMLFLAVFSLIFMAVATGLNILGLVILDEGKERVKSFVRVLLYLPVLVFFVMYIF